MQFIKKEEIPLDKSPPLYVIGATFTGFMLWDCLKYFLPSVPSIYFWSIYIGLSLLLPVAYILPHSVIRKYFDIFGSYWISCQMSFAIGALIDLLGKIIFVDIFNYPSVSYAYISLFIYSISAIATLYGIIHARFTYYKKYDIDTGTLKKPIHIVHLSDLHLGSFNNKKKIGKIVDRVNELEPDMICITGDTFTENLHGIPEVKDIGMELKNLKSHWGTFACLGNHDSGEDFDKMIDFFNTANIKLLKDEYLEKDNITLVGRVDLTPGGYKNENRKSISEILTEVNKNNLIIIMDHQPSDMENADKYGGNLMLSGHTHGGQFFPIHLVVRWFFPHYNGLKKYGNLYSIISPGTCMAIPPIRVGSRSELISIFIK